MERYQTNDGRVLTRTQVEDEFRKARIVAGQPTSGPEYSAALSQWLTTYRPFTETDAKKATAPFKAFGVSMVVVAVFAFGFGAIGGPIAFIVVLVLGTLGSMGVAFFATLFNLPTPPK